MHRIESSNYKNTHPPMNRTLAAASSSAVCLSVSSHHTVSIAVNGFGSSPSLSPPPPPSRGDAAPALAAVLAAADSAAFAAASIALCRFGSVACRAVDNSKREKTTRHECYTLAQYNRFSDLSKSCNAFRGNDASNVEANVWTCTQFTTSMHVCVP